MTFAEVLREWQDSAEFRTFFIELLGTAPFSEFRWETPPIATGSVNRVFEFVLLNNPGLASVPDSKAFAQYFQRSTPESGVVSFPNLGGDATLIVPCPLGRHSAYRQMASFLREAPELQKDSLWKTVGRVMEESVGTDPRWLSTAGAGVSWLHVRIDKRPKYYGYGPYRTL